LTARTTQSVGVPVTETRFSENRLTRSGSVRVIPLPLPDCSSCGATIQTSSDRVRAIRSRQARPSASTPSSLVSRILSG
jgi:hypothetical protein